MFVRCEYLLIIAKANDYHSFSSFIINDCSNIFNQSTSNQANDFSNCNQLQVNYLTEEEKRAIIQAHNEYRQKVANGEETRGNPGPQPAGNIPPLQWDDELATIAQVWADQCQNGHSACDDTSK